MMLCAKCKSAADHPSNYITPETELVHCNHDNGCACLGKFSSVESLYDPETVDIEWVRIRRTTNYSRPEMEQ